MPPDMLPSSTPNLKAWLAQQRQNAVVWARQLLADPQAIILDTETTGLHAGAEIIEISILEVTSGTALLDSLVKPKGNIPRQASAIHGLTTTAVAAAPTWPELHDQVGEILQRASQIVIYNAEFDLRLLRQTRDLYALPPVGPPRSRYHCAMQQYARFMGQWDAARQSFRWQALRGGNHRALGDCRATLQLLKKMSAKG